MTAFGDHLKRARVAKDVSVDDVARATRIARRYLHALERSDLDALPGGVFDRGYIKAYAQFLSIDPDPILEAYSVEERRRGRGTPEDEQQKLEALKKIVDGRRARTSRRSMVPAAVFVAVVGVAAVVSWLALRSGSPDAPPEEAPKTVSRSLSVTSQPSPPEPSTGAEAPDAETAPTAVADDPDLPETRITVAQSGVGSGVVDRDLVGESDRFVEGSRVWFWTRVVGGQSGERIRHVWSHGGRTYVNAELRVGGSHWRTYSSFVLPPGTAGTWTVEARAPDGRVVARAEFQCATPAEGTRAPDAVGPIEGIAPELHRRAAGSGRRAVSAHRFDAARSHRKRYIATFWTAT